MPINMPAGRDGQPDRYGLKNKEKQTNGLRKET